jgi:hypothetical protein
MLDRSGEQNAGSSAGPLVQPIDQRAMPVGCLCLCDFEEGCSAEDDATDQEKALGVSEVKRAPSNAKAMTCSKCA